MNTKYLFNFILRVALLVVLAHIFAVSTEQINDAKIVKYINNNNFTWKAYNYYGNSSLDSNLFAKTRMGIRLKRGELSKWLAKLDKHGNMKNEQKVARNAYVDDTKGDDLPANFSWAATNRTKCNIDYIRDQANCGSCWAVGSASVLQDRLCIKSNGTIKYELSAQYMMTCSKRSWGCRGSYPENALEFLVEDGIITGGDYDSDEGCQPYSLKPCGALTDKKLPCAPRIFTPKCKYMKCSNEWYKHKTEPERRFFKAKSYSRIFEETYAHPLEYWIRKEIYENGPVFASFFVRKDMLFYKKGVYWPKYGNYESGHAVRIIGWGEQDGFKYWIMANSWGRNYGENGYIKYVRGTDAGEIESNMFKIEPDV